MFSSLLLSTFLKLQMFKEMQAIHEVQLIPPVTMTVEGFKI